MQTYAKYGMRNTNTLHFSNLLSYWVWNGLQRQPKLPDHQILQEVKQHLIADLYTVYVSKIL